MSYLSFMYFEAPEYNAPGIPATTIEDSRIGLLFSKNVTDNLMYPCTAELIRERQILIRDMDDENGDFYAALVSLKAALVTLDSVDGGRRLALTDAQKKFKTIRLMRAFIVCEEKIKVLESESELIKQNVRYWKEEKKDYINELIKDTEKCEEEIRSFAPALLRLDRNGYTLKSVGSGEDFICRLEKIGNELGVNMPSRRKIALQTDRAIAEGLEQFNPAVFNHLTEICEKYKSLPVGEMYALKREIDFYLEILNFSKKAKKSGVPVCYPDINKNGRYEAVNAYDISLLYKNTEKIVPNNILFDENNPFCFLTGANGGGKTTYLRTVVINLVFGVCGCPCFAESADIYPCDRIITHFPSDERFGDTGRLIEEQSRIDEMLSASNENSFLCFNETFSGTDDVKGCKLTLDTVEKIKKMKARGLFVTHFHEVSKAGFPMLAALVDTEKDNARTFRIVMNKNGIDSSYANDILKKYHLDRESLERRICDIRKERE